MLGGRPGTREVQRQVGYLPELFRFPGWLTGREVLHFHAKLAEVTVDAGRLLDLVGIGDAGDRRVAEYSKGMQQRLGLAQALVGDPPLVFLDEPTSALDPIGRLEVRDVLLHLRERGTAVFLNSHLLTEIEKVCDRVAVIDRGTIVTQGTTDDLMQTATARIRVGDPDPAAVERFMTGLDVVRAVARDGPGTRRGGLPGRGGDPAGRPLRGRPVHQGRLRSRDPRAGAAGGRIRAGRLRGGPGPTLARGGLRAPGQGPPSRREPTPTADTGADSGAGAS